MLMGTFDKANVLQPIRIRYIIVPIKHSAPHCQLFFKACVSHYIAYFSTYAGKIQLVGWIWPARGFYPV